jgi:hypothetical protein
MVLRSHRVLTVSVVSCFALALAMTNEAGAAVLTYDVIGGIGAAEAEVFTTKVDRVAPADPEAWVTVLDDGNADDIYNGATGGAYLRPLPNNNANVLTLGGPPYVEYRFSVPTAGSYDLYLRAAAGNANDSSIYYQIYKEGTPPVVDGPGNPGQYIAVGPTDNVFRWFEATVFPGPTNPTFDLAADSYIVRINSREDGVGFDKLVLQFSSYAAPTGNGPATTLQVPEPASLMLLAAGGALLLLRRSPRMA